ncbi:uncharacterized protein KY384_000329 [Bacidia gigantensis]|uniref:uncharacterized protein n=1 Tax=Bacidia gigantensis TaxID=2732470 RepID=UPI001D044A3A|nr:uncharacterized protein KY384_000329 [Bacidia gigantensis]KAG8526336.1 hypothetical protein KY384_000329 [Bacidia gigantensis]
MSQLSAGDAEIPGPNTVASSPPQRKAPSGKVPPAREITNGFLKATRGELSTKCDAWSIPDTMVALHVGRLVQDASFSTFEAVSALEIMDPKMDSGYEANGTIQEHEYDVLRPLTPQQVIGIMDQLFCFEVSMLLSHTSAAMHYTLILISQQQMAWHQGFALYQTLFMSYYIDRLLWPKPSCLEEATFDRKGSTKSRKRLHKSGLGLLHIVLRAYCVGLIKACDFVHERISTEKVWEEEDFVSQLYSRSLLSESRVGDVELLLGDARAYVKQQTDLPDTLREAIVDRLYLRSSLLGAVVTGGAVTDNVRHWKHCDMLAACLNKTLDCGEDVPGSYSIRLQRRLATTTPPRSLIQIPYNDARIFFGALCHWSVVACYVLQFHGCSNLLNSVRLFGAQEPRPPVYARCVLQSLLWHDDVCLDDRTFKALILNDLAETVLPASNLIDPKNEDVEVPQDPRFKINEIIDDFIRRSAEAREIDIDLWTYIDDEVDEKHTNGEPRHSNPLSSWARAHKIRIMMWIVQLGFELEIYRPEEMTGMYWYLQYLARQRILTLAHIQHHTLKRLNAAPGHAHEKKTTLLNNVQTIETSIWEVSAVLELADALSNLYSFLAHAGLMNSSDCEYPYSSPELRYELRMRPFASIHDPELPSLTRNLCATSLKPEGTDTAAEEELFRASPWQQAVGILDLSATSAQKAKAKWADMTRWNADKARSRDCELAWQGDVKNAYKAAIATSLAIDTLQKAVKRETELGPVKDQVMVTIPTAEKSHHAWWIVPQIDVME